MRLTKYRRPVNVWNHLFDDFFTTDLATSNLYDKKFNPSVNISESDGAYLVSLVVPGYKKEDIKITAEKDQLLIEGSVTASEETKEEKYLRKEFRASSFSRSFYLPKNVDKESISAQYENGLLNVTIKKGELPEKEKAKLIEVS